MLKLIFRSLVDFEKSVVSIERIRDYHQTEMETDLFESQPKAHWPQSGKIEFDCFKMRYRKGLQQSLKG